jgi:hypothetical protein
MGWRVRGKGRMMMGACQIWRRTNVDAEIREIEEESRRMQREIRMKQKLEKKAQLMREVEEQARVLAVLSLSHPHVKGLVQYC